jgi:hypothetical protein
MSDTQLAKPKWTRRKKVIVAAVAIVLAISVPIFAHLFWEIHEAKVVLGVFNQALIAKDYQKAYSLTTPALRANVDYSAFVKVQDGLTARVGALKSSDDGEAEVRDDENGNFATIRTSLVFERGQLPFVFVLKKESGHWLIYRFNEQ